VTLNLRLRTALYKILILKRHFLQPLRSQSSGWRLVRGQNLIIGLAMMLPLAAFVGVLPIAISVQDDRLWAMFTVLVNLSVLWMFLVVLLWFLLKPLDERYVRTFDRTIGTIDGTVRDILDRNSWRYERDKGARSISRYFNPSLRIILTDGFVIRIRPSLVLSWKPRIATFISLGPSRGRGKSVAEALMQGIDASPLEENPHEREIAGQLIAEYNNIHWLSFILMLLQMAGLLLAVLTMLTSRISGWTILVLYVCLIFTMAPTYILGYKTARSLLDLVD